MNIWLYESQDIVEKTSTTALGNIAISGFVSYLNSRAQYEAINRTVSEEGSSTGVCVGAIIIFDLY